MPRGTDDVKPPYQHNPKKIMASSHKKSTELKPWESVLAWNPTAKLGQFPSWLGKIAVKKLRSLGKYKSGWETAALTNFYMNDERWPRLLDHWGTCGPKGDKSLFVMPYGNHIKAAKAFADECGLEIISPPEARGAWHPETFLFEFRPRRKTAADQISRHSARALCPANTQPQPTQPNE